MKDLKTASWDVAEANQRMQRDFTVQYWAFLITQVNYNEVTFDPATEQIVFAEYIPLTGLLQEVIEKVIQVTLCGYEQRRRYLRRYHQSGTVYLSRVRQDAILLGLLSAVSQTGLMRAVRKWT